METPLNPRSLTTTLTIVALAIVALTAVATGCASTQRGPETMNRAIAFNPSEQVEPATDLLRSYFTALNAADVEAIVPLYAQDAVFMAQHRPPAMGRAEIETAYREIFGMLRLDVELAIDEVVVVSPTVAYARTHSTGTTVILANGAEVSEGNSELFVLVRDNESDDWRIGRYIFSTSQPPRS